MKINYAGACPSGLYDGYLYSNFNGVCISRKYNPNQISGLCIPLRSPVLGSFVRTKLNKTAERLRSAKRTT